jgi:hypothetical protein
LITAAVTGCYIQQSTIVEADPTTVVVALHLGEGEYHLHTGGISGICMTA